MRTPTEALKELRDRLAYFCARLDGKYDPPWVTELIGIIDDALSVNDVEGARHTVGNGAKMRNALEYADKELRNATEDDRFGDDLVYLVGCMRTVAEVCRAALAAPPRNCDVGDADDWEKRFCEECDNSHTCSVCPVRHAKTKMAIEFNKGARCEFIWAQMPCEEGGLK